MASRGEIYILEDCNAEVLKKYLKIIVYDDDSMPVSNDKELFNRLEKLL